MQIVTFERYFEKLSESYEFHPNPFKNGGTLIIQNTDKIKPFNCVCLMLIALKRLKLIKWGWSHFKDLSKNLSEAHEFHPNPFKNDARLISQNTEKIKL